MNDSGAPANRQYRAIEVVEYDPGWPALFEEIRTGLERVLGDRVLEIHHIGSTSVPGLCAKPKIDIDVVLRSAEAISDGIARLKATGGYIEHGNRYRDGMWAFSTGRGSCGRRVYLCGPGTPTHLRRILFRDHLRAHRETADAYAALKRRLASETADDWDHYTGGKAQFVAEITQRAALGLMTGIDIRPLFGPASPLRDAVDFRVLAVASVIGVMTVTGLPDDVRIDSPARSRMLQLFRSADAIRQALSRNSDDPPRPFGYRGWFGARPDRGSYFEAMEIGPDIAHGALAVDHADPLKGPTPLPPEEDLPGWRAAVREHYLHMERVADAIMRSIARALGQREDGFPGHFHGGNSALRLLRYPVRPLETARHPLVHEAHTDFGWLTLLLQDEEGGLQARLPNGDWIGIPPAEGHLVVNFGKLLERWTGGRILATEHRVTNPDRERFSLPFFYEPRLDTRISPLPLADTAPSEPFVYGDHVRSSLPRLQRFLAKRKAAGI